MVYKYSIKGLYKTPASIAGAVCESLANSDGGLTPRRLLDASRPESAPLHGEFEWNDEKAAECYRESQAAGIIKNLIVVETEEQTAESCRAFVNVHSKQNLGNYHPIKVVLDTPDMYEQMMKAARRDMMSFIAKYKSLEKVSRVIDQMQMVLDA